MHLCLDLIAVELEVLMLSLFVLIECCLEVLFGGGRKVVCGEGEKGFACEKESESSGLVFEYKFQL